MAAKFVISDAVRDVLSRSTITADRVVLPPGQLDRKLYEQVNKALEGAGGKWNRSAKAHVFDRDPREALGLAIETGKATNVKQALQAFYTPGELAARMVKHATIKPGQSVLEPSCGAGNILREIVKAAPDLRVLGVEIDSIAAAKAREVRSVRVLIADFLVLQPESWDLFDAIVMNPPFSKGQDMAHVLHAWKFLKPGGTLAAITSPSWRTGRTKAATEFRAFAHAHALVDEDVPAGTFRESGTDVGTVLLVLRRPE